MGPDNSFKDQSKVKTDTHNSILWVNTTKMQCISSDDDAHKMRFFKIILSWLDFRNDVHSFFVHECKLNPSQEGTLLKQAWKSFSNCDLAKICWYIVDILLIYIAYILLIYCWYIAYIVHILLIHICTPSIYSFLISPCCEMTQISSCKS